MSLPRPNLLFVFTDEQRFDTLGCYGNARIRTPNTDRLAAAGVLFERAYVTQPVCTPSRSTLLTGLWPHTSGLVENNIPLPDEVPCLPEMLPPGEYATAYMGKWHLGDEIFAQHGFDEWVSIDDGYRGYYRDGRDRDTRSTYHHWLAAQGRRPGKDNAFTRDQITALPEELSKPAYLADEACRFLDERAADARPFCLFVNFFEPHMPYSSCRDGQYDPASLPLPANFGDVPGEDTHPKHRMFSRTYTEQGFEGCDLRSEEGWRRIQANYYGLCSLVDTHFGRVLQRLEALGLDENTIVVYTSDHGDMMGSHRLLAKCVQFEEAVRVPLIVRAPRAAARRVAGPVSQIDLVPTLLELMGAAVPGHLQGTSWADALTGGGDPAGDVVIEWNGHNNGFGDRIGEVAVPSPMLQVAPRDQVAVACTDPLRTIITADGWKLTHSPVVGLHELYNLHDDPAEARNLAGDEAQQSRIADLTARLAAWQTRTGDSAPLGDTKTPG